MGQSKPKEMTSSCRRVRLCSQFLVKMHRRGSLRMEIQRMTHSLRSFRLSQTKRKVSILLSL